jgi:hypothetical protein
MPAAGGRMVEVMAKGFWSVLEECVGQMGTTRMITTISLDTVERYFMSLDIRLHAGWPDLAVDERERPSDFNWVVERVGEHLKFTPIG